MKLGTLGSPYHFGRGQYQDDVAYFAAVLAPVLRPLQAGNAHMAPLEMLHIAAGAETKRKGGSFTNVNSSHQRTCPSFP